MIATHFRQRFARLMFGALLATTVAAQSAPVQAALGHEQDKFTRQASAMFDAGKQTLKGGDVRGAIKQWQSLRDWARSQPHLEWPPMIWEAMAQWRIADALMESGRYDEAIAEARSGLDNLLTNPHSNHPAAANSKNSVAFSLRGTVAMSYERSHRYPQALAMLDEIDRTFKGDLTPMAKARVRVKQSMARADAQSERASEVRRLAVKRAEEAEARGAGGEALAIYAAAMQALLPGFDSDLAVSAAQLVKRAKALPPVPDEARRYAVYGQTALKSAQESKDYLEAAQNFWRALAIAPWWPDLYLNLGLTFELMDNNQAALKLLQAYAELAPPGETDKVKSKVYELEYKAKHATR